MRGWARVLAMAVGIAACACEEARNYTDPAGPRHAGGWPSPDPDPAIKVVTFNIRYAREIDRALKTFQENESFRGADLIALQEMDAPGTERLAAALGCAFVYYPAAFHPGGGKDFGNAVLSRWPIVEDHKVLLPHASPFRGLRRAAVGATVLVRGTPTRVYSLHLEAPLALSPGKRREQLAAIVEDARSFAGPVVVAGDFNNRKSIGQVLEQAGFTWVTRDLGPTISWFRWDHVFVRGLRLAGPESRGIALSNNGASNHLPVWADLLLEGNPVSALASPDR